MRRLTEKFSRNKKLITFSSSVVRQLRRGSHHDAGPEGLRGQKRVPGQPVPERWRVPEPGPEDTVPVHMSRRILGRKLRTGPGGPKTETRHGRARSHTGLPAHHSQ